jgi:predicted alpha/beta hydrolase family esterase
MEPKKRTNKTPFALRLIQWFFPKLEAVAPSLAHKYFIHLFYTPFRYQIPEKEKEFLASAKEFSVSVEGKRIQCYRWGTTGPKIVMVHGWAGRAGQFRKMIPAFLGAGFQVIAFDGPAHGKSEGKQTNLPEFGEVVREIIEVEGELKGIIAHSFGGVAVLYAIMNGLPIQRVINIASPTMASQVILNYRKALNASEAAGKAFDKHLVEKYGKTFDEFSSLHFVQHLPGPLDLLVVQDENDTEVTVINTTELKRVYPAARIHMTQGLGHTRILKDEGVISLCVDFMKS